MRPIGTHAVLALAFFAAQALAAASYADTPDAITPDGGRYYGPLVGGKLHGRGRIEWGNGARYEGDFADGLMTGRGRMQFADGAVYEGDIRGGLSWGKGEVRYPDGRKYTGDFVRDAFQGKGRLEHPDGDVFEGQFQENELTGQGRYTRKDKATYEGSFRRWKFHGPGRYTDSAGTVYEGDFVDGALQGAGKVTSAASTYEGELKHWQFNGRGVLRHANGDVYEGGFEYGMYEGQGTLTYAKPRKDGRTQETGVWRYGQLHDEAQRRKMLADAEAALYAQGKLLDAALASLKRGEPGKIDMYLLGVAGDGSQEVFRREVDFVQKSFAERFGTAGRSVALINSRNTLTSAPVASVTSIRAALKAIGERMNRDQDILFLFMTSHGSKEHELTLNHAAMPLRGLPAAQLGELLRESRIKWKVVVVSACYSGGFVDALQDDGTLVITAARR
ncbi:MAG TPA: C13 family peptidase, partial [Burkholderiales bacterium]|nr:C13 family peptidase [Burkholderiales bacterium]